MAASLTSPSGRDDPLFQQGMAHLQSGRWAEAASAFEAVAGQYPDDPAVSQALEEVSFKARLDAAVSVRPKKHFFPWRKLIVRSTILILLFAVVYVGGKTISQRVLPEMRAHQAQQEYLRQFSYVNELITAQRYDEAEQALRALLSANPDDPEAAALLPAIEEGRMCQGLYERGVELQKIGDLLAAQQIYQKMQRVCPLYEDRDVKVRLQQVSDQQEIALLFVEGEAAMKAGRYQESIDKLNEVRRRSVSYQKSTVEQYLADCHLALGKEILARTPPSLTDLPVALGHFEQTLSFRTRDAEAALQRDLANRFMQGKARFDEGEMDRAIALLRPIYDVDPNYLGGLVTTLLYDAYVASGDSYRNAGELLNAYEQYRKACQDLNVADNVLACVRFETVIADITPTSTPTATPTSTPTATPTATPQPSATPKPTATPIPRGVLIERYRGKILFYAEKPDQKGWWVMDPDGSNRIYLGDSEEMLATYNKLREQEALSPDGGCRVYTTESGGDEFPQVYAQCKVPPGGIADLPPTWKISVGVIRTSYDPVWSPDGRRIAYVSQNIGGDDIWVASAEDGSEQWNLTPNDWEWDKHPSWGPDSRMIVFWSNREGTKQIFIIDADDQRMWKKISNTTWDEYNPVWLK